LLRKWPESRRPINAPDLAKNGDGQVELLRMEEKPPQPPERPFVPTSASSLAANIAWVNYVPGGGQFLLEVAEKRLAPIASVGEAAQIARFELGRAYLTLYAIRALEFTTLKRWRPTEIRWERICQPSTSSTHGHTCKIYSVRPPKPSDDNSN
jgi:hypothetical protein